LSPPSNSLQKKVEEMIERWGLQQAQQPKVATLYFLIFVDTLSTSSYIGTHFYASTLQDITFKYIFIKTG